MPVTVYDPAGNPRAAVNVSVMPDGVTVRQAKSVKVSDGFGGWRLAWVPPVKVATLSLSKTGVATGEQYNVVLSIPGGVPEGGVTVKFRHGTYSHTTTLAAGATSATLAGATHATATTADWYADVTTLGGTTTFGPVRQTAYARSTATVTGPSWFMSHRCPNPSGLNSIIDPTFTISLSDYTAVTRVELQIASWSDGVFKTIGVWTPGGAGGFAAIPGASWNWAGANSLFDRNGMWSARIVLTFKDGATYESGHYGMDVRVKGLSVASSDYAPPVNTTVALTASCTSGDCGIMYSAAQWFANTGGGWAPDTANNPNNWHAWGTVSWLWREVFADGSVLHSNIITVTPYAAAYAYAENGDAGTIQNCLDIAYGRLGGAGSGTKSAVLRGTFHGGGAVRVPAGVTVDAYGAVFQNIQFLNADTGDRGAAGSGGYSRAGGIVWRGGTFDCWNSKSTAWSISQCPSFHLEGAHIFNTTTKGHGIEINSSGGPAYGGDVRNMQEWDFTIKVLNCTFSGMDATPRDTGYDEAVHFDYSWTGATAAGTASDGTVCHNILVKGCHFQRARTFPYPTSIGNHKFSVNDTAEGTPPREVHSHLRIDGCHFDQVGACSAPGSDSIMSATMASRGTVHLIAFRQVQIANNHFNHNVRGVAFESRTGVPQTQGAYFVHNNTFTANSHMKNHAGAWIPKNYPWVDTDINDNTGGRFNGVYIYNNLFTWVVGSAQATYLIRCNDVDTLHVNGNYFYGLQGNAAYSAKGGNRIHGSEASPSGTVTGYQCRDNMWSSTNPPGGDLAVSNS